jgi:CheY-like chemotaxis protein/MinD-like ATPase involved in chromosome partitioning or flagellar assembly
MAKILIIDDDQDILRLLEFTLKRVGHQVTAATDGVHGLEMVEADKPDLVVADVMMPRMTGYEFCKRVRARPGAGDIPIIVFSARFQPIDKQTALQAGATDYLPKSTSPDILIKRIKELLPASETGDSGNLVIGFFSLKGGAGVTTLAANTAMALAMVKKAAVALVDMAQVGGHTALLLGLRPSSHLAGALASAKLLSTDSLKPHIIEHKTGVHLLASALSFEHQFSDHSSQLGNLMTVLKNNYSFSVLDMSRLPLAEHTAAIWQNLDKVALVLSPDMPSLQSTAMGLQGLAWLGVPPQKIALVVNQTMVQPPLTLETIIKAVKRPVAAAIPFEPEIIKAANNSKPLLLSSQKSPGAAAIARLASILVG